MPVKWTPYCISFRTKNRGAYFFFNFPPPHPTEKGGDRGFWWASGGHPKSIHHTGSD